MSVTFTYVPPVASGDSVTSTQAAKVADAFNDRLRPNAGDVCERIVYLLFTQFRQIRNSDGELVFPPQAEYFTDFQNRKPPEGAWWTAGPGEPEGAALACIMNSFVLGADAIDLDSEDERIANPLIAVPPFPSNAYLGGVNLWIHGGVPTDPADIWELGKQQRGAITLNGALGAPALAAAVEQYKIRAGSLSPHGNSYGGFMPVPEDLADCHDPELPDYQLFFTNLETGEIAGPWGTCPEDIDGVANIIPTPLWYVIYFNNGSTLTLPIDEWIQGPYRDGSAIKRNWGDFVPRVLNAFAHDFRGTPSERENQTSWLQHAFDREKFWANQYHLAPNIGEDAGGGVLNEVYPLFLADPGLGTTIAAGTWFTHDQSATDHHQYADRFVLASALITSTKLAAETIVEFWDGSTLLGSLVLTPDVSGNAADIVTFNDAIRSPLLKVKLPNGATFTDNTGSIEVECTELLDYKPQYHDLYLVLRLASCRTFLDVGLDGGGEDEPNSNEISDSYFANGCILNSHGAPGPSGSVSGEVNSNAVFDAARRLSQHVRILPRDGFIGYAIEADDDGTEHSVCWFRRYGVFNMDWFEGIGPSTEAIASGDLEAGLDYVVRDDTITYNGATIDKDQVFTALPGASEFTGSGTVYEREGIIATARPEGFTNEWLMGTQLKVYNQNEDSIWKPSAYSDWVFWSDRCQWRHGNGVAEVIGETGFSKDLKNQFDYGENFSSSPEAFSGWRYVHNVNAFACDEADTDCLQRRRDRYKSCRIYEPLPEIESATEDFEGGVAVIKLRFKGRFHHHQDAPAWIERNVNAWDVDALRAESYRTMENALREYLVLQDRGFHCVGGGGFGLSRNLGQQGNSAYVRQNDEDPWQDADLAHGACFPHFYFVHLFPKPFEDGNDLPNPSDSPLWSDWWQQADLYLRAMCEGFVDGLTSTELACTLGNNNIFCYTFEGLCFQSHGRKWLTPTATAATSWLSAGQVRTDGPQGFGQDAAISLAAECYNQVAGCLNLLNRVQIMLPQKLQARQFVGTADANVDATWPPSSPPGCSTTGSPVGYYAGTAPGASAGTLNIDWFDLTPGDSISSQVGSSIRPDACSGGGQWILETTRSDMEWRWTLVDPDAIYALPEVWQGIFAGGISLHGRMLGLHSVHDARAKATNVSNPADGSVCGVAGYWVDPMGGYILFMADIAADSSNCQVMSSEGRLSTSGQGASVYAIGRDLIGGSCMNAAVENARIETLTPILGDDSAFVEIPLV